MKNVVLAFKCYRACRKEFLRLDTLKLLIMNHKGGINGPNFRFLHNMKKTLHEEERFALHEEDMDAIRSNTKGSILWSPLQSADFRK